MFDVKSREDEVLISVEQFDKRSVDAEQYTVGVTVMKVSLIII